MIVPMSPTDNALTATLPDAVATDLRLAQEIAHKEHLLASGFAADGRRSLRNRRNEWVVLAGVVAIALTLLVASVR
jgi:hypothetical protein